MIEIVTYILYTICILLLLIAYVKIRSYIKLLKEYIELQNIEIILLEVKTLLQDKLLMLYNEKSKNEKAGVKNDR